MRPLVASIAVLGLVLSSAWFLNADDPPAAADFPGELRGKVAIVTLKSADDFGYYLQGMESRSIAGTNFLVGTQVDDEELGGWSRGRRTWLSLEDVGSIVVFDSIEQLKDAHRDAEADFPNASRDPQRRATPVAHTK